MRKYIINSNDSDQRLDKFILKTCKGLPKSMVYKSIRTKKVKVNDKRCEVSQRLKVNDVVTLYINDDFFSTEDGTSNLRLSSISDELSIVYEDENILIVDKPLGLVVHTDDDGTNDTLIDRVKKYLIGKKEYDPAEENSFAPALCNRLDMNTSGLVVCAKNAKSLRSMNQMLKEGRVHKKYLCLVVSKPPKSYGTIVAYHQKSSQANWVRVIDSPAPDFKQIVTKYRYLQSKGGLHLVEVELVTGRTHQIRAHMSHIGCKLLGDNKYGNRAINSKYGEKYQCLCAYSISFSVDANDYLSYLKGKRFTTDNIPFLKKYGFENPPS